MAQYKRESANAKVLGKVHRQIALIKLQKKYSSNVYTISYLLENNHQFFHFSPTLFLPLANPWKKDLHKLIVN